MDFSSQAIFATQLLLCGEGSCAAFFYMIGNCVLYYPGSGPDFWRWPFPGPGHCGSSHCHGYRPGGISDNLSGDICGKTISGQIFQTGSASESFAFAAPIRNRCSGYLKPGAAVPSDLCAKWNPCGVFLLLCAGAGHLLQAVILPAAWILSHILGPVGVWHGFWISEWISAVVSGCLVVRFAAICRAKH